MFSTLKDLFVNPTKYAKFWTSLGSAILMLATIYFGTALWLPVLIAFAGSLGVFSFKNTPTYPAGK